MWMFRPNRLPLIPSVSVGAAVNCFCLQAEFRRFLEMKITMEDAVVLHSPSHLSKNHLHTPQIFMFWIKLRLISSLRSSPAIKMSDGAETEESLNINAAQKRLLGFMRSPPDTRAATELAEGRVMKSTKQSRVTRAQPLLWREILELERESFLPSHEALTPLPRHHRSKAQTHESEAAGDSDEAAGEDGTSRGRVTAESASLTSGPVTGKMSPGFNP